MILDIASLPDAGMIDRAVIRRGWRRLQQAEVVWASDSYKAQLAQERGELKTLPLVCHNCPPLDYLPEPTWPRDPWLRKTLNEQGASIESEDGCIMLRAGAVGEYGGLEETLTVMRELPSDFVLLMMGRPPSEYKAKLLKWIEHLGLQRRAFLWDRPNDETWKKALQGADIGHLIHGPFPPGYMTRLYELNSSLSNNRLFQYMAAGLPIIAYDDPRMSAFYQEVPCVRVARIRSLAVDLRTILGELSSEPRLREKLGRIGRHAHESKYNWEHQFAPILDAITRPGGTLVKGTCHAEA